MLTIRRASMMDAAEMSRIHALSWKSAYRGIVSQAYLDGIKTDYWVSTFHKWFAQQVFVADIMFLDDRAVGCVTYGESRDILFPGWGEIVSLYLLPDHYRRGYGQKLLAHALERLKADGYRSCYLWVLAGNANARSFYEKNGFAWTGEEGEIEIMDEKLADLRYIYIFEGCL